MEKDDLSSELLEKAEELEIDIEKFDTEDDLQKEVDKLSEKDDDNDGDIEYWKSEAKKAFKTRDSLKSDIRRLKKKNEDLGKSLDDIPSTEEFKTLKDEIKDLREFKQTKEEEEEEKKLESATELEKKELQWKKEFKSFEDRMLGNVKKLEKDIESKEEALGARDKEISSLRLHRLESEIIKEATKYNAYNPTQIYKILKEEFKFDNDLNKYTRLTYDSKGKLSDEQSVAERVEEFLKDKDNENLISSQRKPGTDHHQDPNPLNRNRDKDTDKERFGEYDPKNPELIVEAEEKGLSVEDHIDILRRRDKKLAEIRERKNKR